MRIITFALLITYLSASWAVCERYNNWKFDNNAKVWRCHNYVCELKMNTKVIIYTRNKQKDINDVKSDHPLGMTNYVCAAACYKCR